jgi:hypothetical protein
VPRSPHEDGCAYKDGYPLVEDPERICLDIGCICWCHDVAVDLYEAVVVRNLVAKRAKKT